MKKVWIDPGCITCGLCEFIAPTIFEVTDICHVKPDANVAVEKIAIQEAASLCPVNVIKFHE